MEWTDEGIVLGARSHGETGAVVDLLTRAHGRHLGYVHGARSKRLAPVVQPGNTVSASWRARLDEQMGTYTLEGVTLRSGALMASRLALYGLATMSALLRHLPERDPHPGLYAAADALVTHLDDPELSPRLFVAFELVLLADLGFGLDLGRCAVTGTSEDLVYVSPRTGRAVSRDAGAPYAERLLPLPAFLGARDDGEDPTPEEIAQGFALTGFFLERHVFAPQNIPAPPERTRLLAVATNQTG
ncbi:DNA repair protein RecO [Salinarimonas ramus]|uniref:DNA repair protein RecO n=1 Tax=Salinarimonas ramus TaxID=690164 RepID=A0A917V1V5_9HYPH|nr:DNA repair protein RecO [Salinarimonas ramus]GGK18638.1 DNA repair protein RecO [Salinarimonas ramus]